MKAFSPAHTASLRVGRRDTAFKAVADPTRRRILEQLRGRELAAGEIARRFNVTWPAVSHHLRVLKKAGLVRERRDWRERYYRAHADRIRDVFGSWVAIFDARWAEALHSLKRYVEARREE